MAKKTASLTDQLRSAFERSGWTMYRWAKAAGVTSPVVTRFMHGQRGLSAETFGKLAAALNLELRLRT